MKKKQILVVEDDDGNRQLIKELLTFQNYAVIEADNGRQALSVLAENPVDLILMDISLPDMTGLAVTKQIRLQGKFDHLPIVAFTAHVRQEDADAALAAGATSHVPKPVNIQHLLSEIHRLLSDC